MKQAVVIGSGFSALSSATFLASSGFKVTMLEKNGSPGGRGRKFVTDGFTFDMGPSWYLMPDVFEAFFKEFGKKPSDYYELIRIDPSYRIFFDGEGVTDVSADLELNIDLFNSFEENGGEKLREYLSRTGCAISGIFFRPWVQGN